MTAPAVEPAFVLAGLTGREVRMCLLASPMPVHADEWTVSLDQAAQWAEHGLAELGADRVRDLAYADRTGHPAPAGPDPVAEQRRTSARVLAYLLTARPALSHATAAA